MTAPGYVVQELLDEIARLQVAAEESEDEADVIAYGFQGGPHMLTDALVLAGVLLFVFGLGWYTGRRRNVSAAELGNRTFVRNTWGSNKAGPAAFARHRVPNRHPHWYEARENG